MKTKTFFSGLVTCLTMFCFLTTSILWTTPAGAQSLMSLPAADQMVQLSPSFTPAAFRGIRIYPDNLLRLDFIVEPGDANTDHEILKEETRKLIRYFLASLTVPEGDLWVNLSPYEKDRIVPEALGVTDMGRDMLAQDYLLKQITSSLMYPEDEIGKAFWSRVYEIAYQRLGTTEIPMETFNKVWIVPKKVVVHETGDTAFLAQGTLKVMLEEDYVARKNDANNRWTDNNEEAQRVQAGEISAEVIRSVIIPELEREVNQGENFAPLRQIFHSLSLAVWYKDYVQQTIMNEIYIGKNKIDGIDINDKDAKQKIYQLYVEAFKKGVYDIISEEYDPATQTLVPRKYFSGGLEFNQAMLQATEIEEVPAAVMEENIADVNNAMLVQVNLLNTRKFVLTAAALAISAVIILFSVFSNRSEAPENFANDFQAVQTSVVAENPVFQVPVESLATATQNIVNQVSADVGEDTTIVATDILDGVTVIAEKTDSTLTATFVDSTTQVQQALGNVLLKIDSTETRDTLTKAVNAVTEMTTGIAQEGDVSTAGNLNATTLQVIDSLNLAIPDLTPVLVDNVVNFVADTMALSADLPEESADTLLRFANQTLNLLPTLEDATAQKEVLGFSANIVTVVAVAQDMNDRANSITREEAAPMVADTTENLIVPLAQTALNISENNDSTDVQGVLLTGLNIAESAVQQVEATDVFAHEEGWPSMTAPLAVAAQGVSLNNVVPSLDIPSFDDFVLNQAIEAEERGDTTTANQILETGVQAAHTALILNDQENPVAAQNLMTVATNVVSQTGVSTPSSGGNYQDFLSFMDQVLQTNQTIDTLVTNAQERGDTAVAEQIQQIGQDTVQVAIVISNQDPQAAVALMEVVTENLGEVLGPEAPVNTERQGQILAYLKEALTLASNTAADSNATVTPQIVVQQMKGDLSLENLPAKPMVPLQVPVVTPNLQAIPWVAPVAQTNSVNNLDTISLVGLDENQTPDSIPDSPVRLNFLGHTARVLNLFLDPEPTTYNPQLEFLVLRGEEMFGIYDVRAPFFKLGKFGAVQAGAVGRFESSNVKPWTPQEISMVNPLDRVSIAQKNFLQQNTPFYFGNTLPYVGLDIGRLRFLDVSLGRYFDEYPINEMSFTIKDLPAIGGIKLEPVYEELSTTNPNPVAFESLGPVIKYQTVGLGLTRALGENFELRLDGKYSFGSDFQNFLSGSVGFQTPSFYGRVVQNPSFDLKDESLAFAFVPIGQTFRTANGRILTNVLTIEGGFRLGGVEVGGVWAPKQGYTSLALKGSLEKTPYVLRDLTRRTAEAVGKGTVTGEVSLTSTAGNVFMPDQTSIGATFPADTAQHFGALKLFYGNNIVDTKPFNLNLNAGILMPIFDNTSVDLPSIGATGDTIFTHLPGVVFSNNDLLGQRPLPFLYAPTPTGVVGVRAESGPFALDVKTLNMNDFYVRFGATDLGFGNFSLNPEGAVLFERGQTNTVRRRILGPNQFEPVTDTFNVATGYIGLGAAYRWNNLVFRVDPRLYFTQTSVLTPLPAVNADQQKTMDMQFGGRAGVQWNRWSFNAQSYVPLSRLAKAMFDNPFDQGTYLSMGYDVNPFTNVHGGILFQDAGRSYTFGVKRTFGERLPSFSEQADTSGRQLVKLMGGLGISTLPGEGLESILGQWNLRGKVDLFQYKGFRLNGILGLSGFGLQGSSAIELRTFQTNPLETGSKNFYFSTPITQWALQTAFERGELEVVATAGFNGKIGAQSPFVFLTSSVPINKRLTTEPGLYFVNAPEVTNDGLGGLVRDSRPLLIVSAPFDYRLSGKSSLGALIRFKGEKTGINQLQTETRWDVASGLTFRTGQTGIYLGQTLDFLNFGNFLLLQETGDFMRLPQKPLELTVTQSFLLGDGLKLSGQVGVGFGKTENDPTAGPVFQGGVRLEFGGEEKGGLKLRKLPLTDNLTLDPDSIPTSAQWTPSTEDKNLLKTSITFKEYKKYKRLRHFVKDDVEEAWDNIFSETFWNMHAPERTEIIKALQKKIFKSTRTKFSRLLKRDIQIDPDKKKELKALKEELDLLRVKQRDGAVTRDFMNLLRRIHEMEQYLKNEGVTWYRPSLGQPDEALAAVGDIEKPEDVGGIDINLKASEIEKTGTGINKPVMKGLPIPIDIKRFQGFNFNIIKFEPLISPLSFLDGKSSDAIDDGEMLITTSRL